MLRTISLLTVLAGVATQATASITISDFILTERALTFTVSGTLPGADPSTYPGTFILINNKTNEGDPNALARFEVEMFTSTATFTAKDIQSTRTGRQEYGDYLIIQLTEGLERDTGLAGTFVLEWDSDVFDPTMARTIDLYWGIGPAGTLNSGVYLTSVPEPSTYAAIGGGVLFALALTRRLRRKG